MSSEQQRFTTMVDRMSILIVARGHEGVTLIELLLVVALASLVAVIALPSYTAYVDKSRIQVAITDIYKIEAEIQRFKYSNAENPPLSLAEVNMDTLLDPWGKPYEFLNFSTVKGKGKKRKDKNLNPVNTDYDLYSKGKDGKSSTPFTASHSHDDIVRCNDGSYVGLAEDY